jgi:phosphomannomutase
LNEKGEFVSGDDGAEILRLAESTDLDFAEVGDLGTLTTCEDGMDWHIDQVLALPSVDVAAVQAQALRSPLMLCTAPEVLPFLCCSIHWA